jgi:HK97 family phage major capsid protein
VETIGEIQTARLCLSRAVPAFDIDSKAPAELTWKELHERRRNVEDAMRGLLDYAKDQKRTTLNEEENIAWKFVGEISRGVGKEFDHRSTHGVKGPRKGPNPDPEWCRLEGGGSRSGGIVIGREEKTGKEIRGLRPSDSFARAIRSDDRSDALSANDFFRAALLGARNESEKRGLMESSAPGGGFLLSELLSATVIDLMRANTVAIAAGALTVPMETQALAFARVDSDPVPTWGAESGLIGESAPTFGRITMVAKRLACVVKASRELIEDVSNVGQTVTDSLSKAMGLELDRVVHLGNGVLEPLGIKNLSGVNLVDLGGNGVALSGYDNILDAIYELDNDNVPPVPRTAVMAPRTLRDMRKMKDVDGQPLVMPDGVSQLQRLTSTSIPITDTQGSASNASRIYVGHYPHVLIGMRTQIEITALRELYAGTGEVGFLAWMRADLAYAHDNSFCVIKGVLPAS